MPTYEYRCAACGYEFEEWQKITDSPIKTCPQCKKRKVERLLSATAFHLKGGGWYADGYASQKGGSEKKDADAPQTSGEGKASDTKEAKPAAAKPKKKAKASA